MLLKCSARHTCLDRVSSVFQGGGGPNLKLGLESGAGSPNGDRVVKWGVQTFKETGVSGQFFFFDFFFFRFCTARYESAQVRNNRRYLDLLCTVA